MIGHDETKFDTMMDHDFSGLLPTNRLSEVAKSLDEGDDQVSDAVVG